MADDGAVEVNMEGLSEAIEKLDPTLYAEPLRQFFTKAAILLQGAARQNAMERWHDTGHTANSIVYAVDEASPPQWAHIGLLNADEGSPLWYKARAGEYGTGAQGDPAVSHEAKHWPPGDALDVWAGRHGFANGAAVARAIGMRGGIEPRRYLRDAMDASVAAINEMIGSLIQWIADQWGNA